MTNEELRKALCDDTLMREAAARARITRLNAQLEIEADMRRMEEKFIVKKSS
jgi:hypothetical protein